MTPKYKHSWEYTGSGEYWKIVQWCLDMIGYEGWCYKDDVLYFENDKDYAFFMLRWA